MVAAALCIFSLTVGCGDSNKKVVDEESVAREQAIRDRKGILQRTSGRWDLLTPDERAHWLAPVGGNEARAKAAFEAEYAKSVGG